MCGLDARRRRDDLTRERLSPEIGDRQARACGSEIDARDVGVPRVELHQPRPTAATGRRRAEIADDAGLNQMRCEASDSRRRQPRRLDNLRAGERARPLDRDVEHALDVEASEMTRMASARVRRAAPERPMRISHFPNRSVQKFGYRQQ